MGSRLNPLGFNPKTIAPALSAPASLSRNGGISHPHHMPGDPGWGSSFMVKNQPLPKVFPILISSHQEQELYDLNRL